MRAGFVGYRMGRAERSSTICGLPGTALVNTPQKRFKENAVPA
jgi:hypothetical protein